MKKIDKKLIFILLFWITLLLGFFVKSFYVQYSIKLTDIPYNDDSLIIMFMLISSVIITLTMGFVFGRFKYIGSLIFAFVIGLTLFVDSLYGRYYGLPISLPILYQVSFIDDISASTNSLFKWKDVIFFLDIPILLVCAIALRDEYKNKLKLSHRAIIVLLIGLSVFNFNNLAKDVNTIHHAYERKNIAKDFGVYYFHGYDLLDTCRTIVEKVRGVSDENLDRVVKLYNERPELEALADNYESYNLIVVQIEAMQEFIIDLEVEGRQVTPYLNSLKNNNLYFENIYHQVAGGNTSDAEFLQNTSLYPAPVGAVNYLYSQNKFNSIADALNPMGYETKAYHGYQSSFWNRSIMYNTMHYDEFIGQEKLDLDEKVGWAISDKSFYRQALSDVSTDKAFYKFLVTLSSHHPYDAFRKDEFNVGEFENSQLGDYIKSMSYIDKTIKYLFDELDRLEVRENTLVVIYGDHSALYLDQKQPLNKLLKLKENEVAWQSIQKVPLFIITPDGKYNERIDKVGGQIDILPTLAHLMNFKMPYAIGKSLLSDEDAYAVKRDGSIFFDDYYYSNALKSLYNINTYESVPIDADAKEKIDDYYETMIVSDLILKYDVLSRKGFYEALKNDKN